MTYDYERNRQIDREVAQYEASGLFPFLAILGLIVAGIVIYQYAPTESTTQTVNMPTTMEKIAPTATAPRASAETTGSGAAR